MLVAFPVIVQGAAKLEDHSQSWGAAGLSEGLVHGYTDALPPKLFASVVEAAPQLLKESIDGSTYKFGKKNTWWLPLFHSKPHDSDHMKTRVPPRSDLEVAIHALHDLDFGEAETPIVGAEWWIQEQGADQGIGFHYDKDEAYASEHMTMKFPEVSTVTYLSPVGAPTLILNQTTPDGNKEIPELPLQGFLVHPLPNKHLIFRGNLQHGVSGELSHWAVGGAARGTHDGSLRRTLLVNWWRQAPMEPNCVRFDAKRWRRLGMLREGGTDLLVSHADGAQRLTWSATEPAEPPLRQVVIQIPPRDLLYFQFPVSLDMAHDNWQVTWTPNSALGPIAQLDLQHQSSTGSLFADHRPKVFLVLPMSGQPRWAGSLPKWLPRLYAKYAHILRFVLADPNDASASGDFLNHFQLASSMAPTVVVHDTGRNGKHYLQEPMTAQSVRKFIDTFVRKVLGAEHVQQRDEL